MKTKRFSAVLLVALGCAADHRPDVTPGRDVVEVDAGTRDAGPRDDTPRLDEPEGTADCSPGERRDALPAESGSYCLCVEDAGRRWRCYGPDPKQPPAGGAAGSPRAACGRVYALPGQESCLVQWGDCSDGHLYAVTCIEGACVCLVDNTPATELEPMTSCPEDDQINELCGWELDIP